MNIANRPYDVVFGDLAGIARQMTDAGLRKGPCLVVTDNKVAELYLKDVHRALTDGGWKPVPISIPPGEPSKSSKELSRLYDFALDQGIDRTTPLVALGGGVVGDLAGFCAATVLRGIPLVHVPTTLVAQVDSSIGGKTGINHPRGKNLIGAFHQPRLVYSDVTCLASLSEPEWYSGLAEAVKHALIDGPNLIRQMLTEWEALAERDPETLRRLIPRLADVKVGIVTKDVHEDGIRAHLNLGHTVAHAVEQTAGYGRILHGQAVTIGLAVALRLSELRYQEADFSGAWALVGRLPKKAVDDIAFEKVALAMGLDKKNVGGELRFVLLSRPGEACLVSDVGLPEIEDAWEWMQNR